MYFRRARILSSVIILILVLISRAYHKTKFGAERGTHLVYNGPSAADADDYILEAESALDAKNLDASLKALTEAIRLEPSRPEAYIQRAIVYDLKKDYDQAVADCTAAIKLDAKNGHAFYVRGVSRANKSDHDGAIQDLTAALGLDQGNADCYLRRGDSYEAKKDLARALSDFNDAIRLDPAKGEAFTDRGRLYEDKKEYENAAADYAQAIVVDRDDPLAYNNLAWIYATCPKAELRNGKLAVEYALYACRRTEWKEPEYFDTLAAAYAEVGQFGEAVKWVKKALESADFKSDHEAAGRVQKRLYCYQAGKPYRAD
jgi:tetratricopeptide (TPR) repeat protein